MFRFMMWKSKRCFRNKLFTIVFIKYVILMAMSVNAIAGVGVWTGANGPYGGRINALSFTPDGSCVYAGAPDGIYKSVDGGDIWINVTPDIIGSSIFALALAIDPALPETVYVSFNDSIYKTNDGGNSWIELFQFVQDIESIKIDPNNSDVIYAEGRDSLYRSIDGGKNWSTLGGGRIRAFEISLTQPNTVYAFSYYHDAKRDGYYVQKSEDAGESWTIVSGNLTDSNSTMWDINILAIDPTDPNIIYAAGHNGVYKSMDGGKGWIQTMLADSGSFQALVIDPQNPDIIHASASQGEKAGVLKSLDGGNTWLQINLGLTNRSVWTLAINPVSPDVILVGTFGGGIFKTVNGGNSWKESSFGLNRPIIISLAISPTSPSTIYAGTLNGNGIYKTTDRGMSWTQINSGLTTTRTSYFIGELVIDQKNPMIVYVATLDGIFKSTNGGDTWVEANSGLADVTITDLAIDPTTSSTIYAAGGGMSLDDGIYKSVDSGNSWKHISSGLPVGERNINTVAVHPTEPSILYAGTGGGVFKSTNAGESWTNTAVDEDRIRRMNGYALVIDPITPDVIYTTGINRANFKSIDGGNTWKQIGSATGDIGSLVIHQTMPNIIYGGNNAGVFRSTDGGMTWIQINNGLTNTSVRAIALELTTETIYVATEGGIFAYSENLLPTSIAKLAISSNELNIVSGKTQQFTVTAVNENNNPVNVESTDIIWEVMGGVGTIDNSGLFTAIHAGHGGIKATLKSNTFIFDKSNTVTVSPSSIATIYIWHYGNTVFSGQKQTFRVRANDANDNRIEVRESDINWEVIGNIGNISTDGSADGRFTGTITGKGKIKATLKDAPSIFDEAGIIVIGPNPPLLDAIKTPVERNTFTLTGKVKFQFSADIVYEMEVFVNGISKGTTTTEPDTGNFNIPDILLFEEHNEITAKIKDAAGNVSDTSIPTVISLPKRPENVITMNFLMRKVRLSWINPEVEEAKGFNIYRSKQNVEHISQLTPVASNIINTEYIDQLKEHGTYFYVVTAFDAIGNESLPSEIVKIDYQEPLITPENVTITDFTLGKVRLSWQVPEAEKAKSYNVYRSKQNIKQISQLTPIASGNTDMEYIDQLKEYGTYFYAVTALDAIGTESLPSNIVKIDYEPIVTIALMRKNISLGNTFDVMVQAENLINVYGFQFDLEFNPCILTLLPQNIIEGDFLKSDGSDTYWMKPTIVSQCPELPDEPEIGLAQGFLATRLGTTGVSGNGTFANMKFRATAPGATSIKLKNLKISNPAVQPLSVRVVDAEFTVTIPWDINKDGIVDIFDLATVATSFGEDIPPETEPKPDVNGDGVVDISDLVLVAKHFGEKYEVKQAPQ